VGRIRPLARARLDRLELRLAPLSRGLEVAEARRAEEARRLEGRGPVDVEADAVAALDSGHGGCLLAPHERDEQRVAGCDRWDRRQEEADSAGDDGVEGEPPQAVEEDRSRLELREGGALAGARHQARDPARGLGTAPEHEAGDRRERPPSSGEDGEPEVAAAARPDRRYERECARRSGEQQRGRAQEVRKAHGGGPASARLGECGEHLGEPTDPVDHDVGALDDLAGTVGG
jgi:hypothetical protein